MDEEKIRGCKRNGNEESDLYFSPASDTFQEGGKEEMFLVMIFSHFFSIEHIVKLKKQKVRSERV